VSWASALLALLVCHAVGDVLLQTNWQAVHKVPGLGDPVARRALVHHVTTYTLAFVPALVWIGGQTSTVRALEVCVLIAIPHLLIDDGRFVRVWLRQVKGSPEPNVALAIAVDQSFHVLCLLAAALVAAA
jgi:Protein of unknown function (DUF3307)